MNYYNEIKEQLIKSEIYDRAKDYSKDKHKVKVYFETGKLLSEAGKEYGKNVICHATTRSKIDVMKSEFDGEGSGIKLRCNVRSAYENGRNTYIYNTNEPTDIVLVITDSNNRDLFEHTVADIKNAIGYFGINIVGIVI